MPDSSLCIELEWIAFCFYILCVSQDLLTEISTFFQNIPEEGMLMMLIDFYKEDPAGKKWIHFAKIDILTVVLITVQFFWDKAPSWLVNRYRCFRGDCLLHLQDACNSKPFANWHDIIPQKLESECTTPSLTSPEWVKFAWYCRLVIL